MHWVGQAIYGVQPCISLIEGFGRGGCCQTSTIAFLIQKIYRKSFSKQSFVSTHQTLMDFATDGCFERMKLRVVKMLSLFGKSANLWCVLHTTLSP